jgi:hypothetical protein
MAEEFEELVGVVRAGAMTGLSEWTWRRYAYEGTVRSVKIGRRLLIPKAEIQRIISANSRPRRADLVVA